MITGLCVCVCSLTVCVYMGPCCIYLLAHRSPVLPGAELLLWGAQLPEPDAEVIGHGAPAYQSSAC